MNTQTTKCIKYFHYNSATKIRMSLDEFLCINVMEYFESHPEWERDTQTELSLEFR